MVVVIYRETCIPGVAATFCVPRIFYQDTTNSSSRDLKNIAKVTTIKILFWG